MNKNAALLLIFLGLIGLINPSIPIASAQGDSESITISSDYTFTRDYANTLFIIQESYLVIDGAGHTIQNSRIFLPRSANVTIKNLIFQNCQRGIDLDSAFNCTINNNIFSGTITVLQTTPSETSAIKDFAGKTNTIRDNTFEENEVALMLSGAPSDVIYHNNFINNQIDISPYYASWSAGPDSATFSKANVGNYWSKYNGTDNNHDGIGDALYVIDENNIDYYPLIGPVILGSPFQSPSPTPSPTRVVVSLSESASALNYGNTINFTSSAEGGTPPYTYTWYIDSQGSQSSVSPYFSTNSLPVGSHHVFVQVNDANGNSATTNTVSFEVLPASSPSSSIPEFPSFIAVPFLMAAALAGVIIYKKKQFKRT